MKFLATSVSLLAFCAKSSLGFTSTARSFTRTSMMALAAEKLPIMATEDAMSQKKHGTSDAPVMQGLRWNCDFDTADRICNFNRHYAEHAGTCVLCKGAMVRSLDLFSLTTSLSLLF